MKFSRCRAVRVSSLRVRCIAFLTPLCSTLVTLLPASTASAQCPNTLVAWGFNNEGQCNVPEALGTVKSMAAGDTWSVAFARGRLRTWGSPPTGSGVGWANPPQDPTLGGGVPQLAIGYRHAVALNPQNGRIACWGNNFHGECNVPADLPPVKAIAAGFSRTLVIEAASGLVRTWGDSSDGLGGVPSDLGPCRAIASGNRHNVAATVDGTLRCWGSNFRNACDLPAVTTGFMLVSSRNFHSLAQRGDLSLHAWGWNDNGQCVIPAGLGEVREGGFAAGDLHSAAIVWDGGAGTWTVRCWGSNDSGACDVPSGLRDVVAVAASSNRTMALQSDGRVVAWGANDHGQSQVPDVADNPVDISGGYEFSIASSGTPPYRVFAWGNNQYGQQNLPQPTNGLRYRQLSAGWSHSIGLLSDGTVRCSGGSWEGHCGNMPPLSGIRQVAASNFFSVALGNDDVLHVWGQLVGGWPSNFWNGALARTIAVNSETQAMITPGGTFLCVSGWYPYTSGACDDGISGEFGDIVQLAVGGGHVLARRSDGSVYAWAALSDDPNLAIPGSLGTVVEIAAGYSHSVALNSSGRVSCWGRNNEGQCNVPLDIGKVKKIAAGKSHTIAIRDFSTPFTGATEMTVGAVASAAAIAACPYGRGDLNADGFVDRADLAVLFLLWGSTDAEIGDLSGNGLVDGDDLGILLSNWDAGEGAPNWSNPDEGLPRPKGPRGVSDEGFEEESAPSRGGRRDDGGG